MESKTKINKCDHSSILAWRIPWTEEPGGLYSPWGRRVGYDWTTEHACMLISESSCKSIRKEYVCFWNIFHCQKAKSFKIFWVFRTEGVLGPRVQMNTVSPRSPGSLQRSGQGWVIHSSSNFCPVTVFCVNQWTDANTQSLPQGKLQRL